MAKVEMELSELDALRESLKEIKFEKEKLVKELDNIRLSHSKEIDDLKKGALVIERTPNYEIKHGLHIDKDSFINRVLHIINSFSQYRSRGYEFNEYFKIKVEELIRDYSSNMIMGSPRLGETSLHTTIESIRGFCEVENEVREFYNKKYSTLISKYEDYIDKFNSYKKELKEKSDKESDKLLAETDFKIKTIKDDHDDHLKRMEGEFNERLKILEETHKIETEALIENHKAEIIKLKPKDAELVEVLLRMGYRIKPGNFFNKEPKLVKINES